LSLCYTLSMDSETFLRERFGVPDDLEEKALRFNSGKPPLHYILYYPRFIEAISRVQEQGAHKYGYGNWRRGGKPSQEYWDSGLRHLMDAFWGDHYDEDLGTRTLAMAIWNFIQILELNDDLPAMNPDFDQDAFIKRWENHPKNELPMP
jgi:hypothetical protein